MESRLAVNLSPTLLLLLLLLLLSIFVSPSESQVGTVFAVRRLVPIIPDAVFGSRELKSN